MTGTAVWLVAGSSRGLGRAIVEAVLRQSGSRRGRRRGVVPRPDRDVFYGTVHTTRAALHALRAVFGPITCGETTYAKDQLTRLPAGVRRPAR